MLDERSRSVVSHTSDPGKIFVGEALAATAQILRHVGGMGEDEASTPSEG